MDIYVIDNSGEIVGVMPEKTALNAVTKDRALWIGHNVVKMDKYFHNPQSIDLDIAIVPLPGSARPELIFFDDKREDETKDVSVVPNMSFTGRKRYKETVSACWDHSRRVIHNPDIDCSDLVHNDVLEIFGESESENKTEYIGGNRSDTRPMYRLTDGERNPITIIDGVFPGGIPTYHNSDIGDGLTGLARKFARRDAFRRLGKVYSELLGQNMIHVDRSDQAASDSRYLPREVLLRRIQDAIWRFLGHNNDMWRQYRDILSEIVSDSQVDNKSAYNIPAIFVTGALYPPELLGLAYLAGLAWVYYRMIKLIWGTRHDVWAVVQDMWARRKKPVRMA